MPNQFQGLFGEIRPGWTAAYGAAPMVPAPGTTAATAIRRNIGNLGGIYDLAGSMNMFSNAQAAQQLSQNLPLYDEVNRAQMENIQDWSEGIVSPDVINLLAQQAAERGGGGGQAEWSPNANAAYLRALGLTSQGLQRDAVGAFTEAIGRTPRGPMLDTSKFLISPQEEQEAEYWSNLYASMPNPQASAMAQRNLLNQGLQAGRGGGFTSSWGSGSSTITRTPVGAGGEPLYNWGLYS